MSRDQNGIVARLCEGDSSASAGAAAPQAVRVSGYAFDLNMKNGYGFIQGDDGRTYFLHARQVIGYSHRKHNFHALGIKGGVLVEFTPGPDNVPDKKPRALRIQVIQ